MGEGPAGPSPQPPSSTGEWSRRLRRAFLEAAADVAAGARRAAVVHAERPAVLALVIATAMAQARVTTAEIPAIRDIRCGAASGLAGVERPLKSRLCGDGEILRPSAYRQTYQDSIGAVAELGRVLDDVQAAGCVVTAVQPVVCRPVPL